MPSGWLKAPRQPPTDRPRHFAPRFGKMHFRCQPRGIAEAGRGKSFLRHADLALGRGLRLLGGALGRLGLGLGPVQQFLQGLGLGPEFGGVAAFGGEAALDLRLAGPAGRHQGFEALALPRPSR